MNSSYKEHDYGKLFYNIIMQNKPNKVVELGVLDGYSALHFAKGLKSNNKGRLYCYDLWEEYQYSHGNFDEVFTMLYKQGVKDYVTLRIGNAFEVHTEWKEKEIDILHVDISNDGSIVRRILELWTDKVKMIIAFEGGSQERDNVEWMKKYYKEPMLPEFSKNEIIKEQFDKVNFLSFPSLTLLFKKDYRQGL